MKIIRILPTNKFGGSWCAFEAPGVEPCYPGSRGKELAISYAKNRFGATSGEVEVYADDGITIVETIPVDDGGKYGALSRPESSSLGL